RDTTKVDTLKRDSLRVDTLRRDSIQVPVWVPFKDSIIPRMKLRIGSDSLKYLYHPLLTFTEPIRYTVTKKEWNGKEAVFYSVVILLLFFAFIKNSFHRYYIDLFKTFFRSSLRLRQIKEHLQSSPLPSLLFNLFFVLCGGMFAAIVFQHFGIRTETNFWLLTLYCAVALAIIYAGKFVFLNIIGWILQVSEAVNTYLFIVFTTNKVIGILLLPVLVILAFTTGWMYQAALTLSVVLLVSAYLYRFLLSYISINHLLRINIFHFFIYLLAFEIVPLLLINKLLVMLLAELY
ncbi:MAG: DUF4271 domain-containing protein, partial [Candidatus Dadabacteria bacterium]